MRYQLADLVNGPFGEKFASIEAAELALAEEIEMGKKLNREGSEDGSDLNSDGTRVEDFFSIVKIE